VEYVVPTGDSLGGGWSPLYGACVIGRAGGTAEDMGVGCVLRNGVL